MTPAEAVTILYRRASLRSHPDLGGSTAEMAEVNAAAEVLRRAAPEPPVWSACTRPHTIEEPEDWAIPFGKYTGQYWSELPLGYLSWLAEESYNQHSRNEALRWLHWRTRPTR